MIGTRYSDFPITAAYARTFSGWIDEPRMYNRVLSTGEIQQLYYANLNKYAPNKWMFTTIRSGLTTTLIYSGQAFDLAGNSSGSETRMIQ